jgi:NCS1 family nucleobase:cation symporter-1
MIISEHSSDISDRFIGLIDLNNILIKENIFPLITIIGTMFAYFSIVILNFGDFSRYAKNETELNKGNLSLVLNLILFSMISLLIVIGADIILNNGLTKSEKLLTNPTDIIGKFNNIYLTVAALLFILVASLSTNLIANYIPTQNALLNFLPKQLSLKSSGFIIIFIGFFIGLFWLPVLSQIGILSFLDTVGAFFGPMFGLMIADYYAIKKKYS